MTSPLIVPIADALEAAWDAPIPVGETRSFLADATTAADACIAVIAALPADYTAVDVLAHLRGDDVPSEPLPVRVAGYECCDCCPDELRAEPGVASHPDPCPTPSHHVAVTA